jgi:hypothetical protein
MGQLVFSGGLFPVAGAPVVAQLSWLIPARWGYAAVASSINANAVLRLGDPAFKTGHPDALWNHTAATYAMDVGLAALVGVAAIALCAYLLRRSDPKPAVRQE